MRKGLPSPDKPVRHGNLRVISVSHHRSIAKNRGKDFLFVVIVEFRSCSELCRGYEIGRREFKNTLSHGGFINVTCDRIDGITTDLATGPKVVYGALTGRPYLISDTIGIVTQSVDDFGNTRQIIRGDNFADLLA